MKISLIAAIASNNVIGKDNKLIWNLPADMKFFKEKTSGHCIITGRKNYESIPERFRPLPNRTNIVITRQSNYTAPGAIIVDSVEKAINTARSQGESEVFVIGGADIYRQTLDIADILYITHIEHSFEGDVFFPAIDSNKWKEEKRIVYKADEKNKYDFSIVEYRKNK
jgi:dihydrofolate reductase